MYASDYIYALDPLVTNNWTQDNDIYSEKLTYDWLEIMNYEKTDNATISVSGGCPKTQEGYVQMCGEADNGVYSIYSGKFTLKSKSSSPKNRPTFYLNSDVKIVGYSEGTYEDPLRIKIQ